MKCLQLEACVHPFFDELRDPNCRLPNGRPLPPLFNFKPQGESSCSRVVPSQSVAKNFRFCPLLHVGFGVRSPGLSVYHFLVFIFDFDMVVCVSRAELKGATPDILQRLIPEHARKQNPMLAL